MSDRVRPIRWIDRYLMDAADTARRHDGIGELTLPVGRALELKDRLRAAGERVSFHHVLIKAAALALREVPEANRLRGGYRIVEPDSIDISSSVSLPMDLPFAPVVVVRWADQKSLPAIAEEMRRKIEEVPGQIEQLVKQVNRWGWLLPLPVLRRRLLRRLQKDWKLQRKLCGTFQISSLGAAGLEMMYGSMISTSCLLGVGAIQKTDPPTLPFTLHIDHRVVSGEVVPRVLQALGRALDDPEALLAEGRPE